MQIPIRSDAATNEQALGKVRADKEREASDSHDGTWVAHPGLVPIALEEFEERMPRPNQIDKRREDVNVSAADLLEVPKGTITERRLRHNLNVGVLYLEPWLRGIGCVPIYNLMEDAATAEISRAQVWQWRHHGAKTDDGQPVDEGAGAAPAGRGAGQDPRMVGDEAYAASKYDAAAAILRDLVTAETFVEFLTLLAYEQVVTVGDRRPVLLIRLRCRMLPG